MIPFGRPGRNGQPGLEVEASAGVGGARLALGRASFFGGEGDPILIVVDILVGLTRTWNSPDRASSDSTYVGLEYGMMGLAVRVSAGVAHRVAGPEGPKATIFTWSVGMQAPW